MQPWLWTVLLIAFAARTASSNKAVPQQATVASDDPLTDEDLVIVMGTCAKRLVLAQASAREARGNSTGIRIVYGLDNSTLAEHMQQHVGAFHNEFYVWWPDRPPSIMIKGKKGKPQRLKLSKPFLPGDSRVSMMPWLAHKALQDAPPYKWLLYGDDDTFFFLHGVRQLLRSYDHSLPYVISDSFWHHIHKNQADAPRCSPCHGPGNLQVGRAKPKADASDNAVQPKQPPLHVPPRGCPCTPELACNFTLHAMQLADKAASRDQPFKWCPESKLYGFPKNYPTLCDFSHFHGGSGVLVSVGAMQKVPFNAAVACYYDNVDELSFDFTNKAMRVVAHGDRLTSLCFWVNGIALTDPGYALGAGRTIDSTRILMDNRAATLKVLQQLQRGELSSKWGSAAVNMTAVHLHLGRRDPHEVLQYVHDLSRTYRNVLAQLLTQKLDYWLMG